MNTMTVAPPRVPVAPARPELDEVLREVNRIRTARGGDAIYELPKGECGTGRGCVIFNALVSLGAQYVYSDSVLWRYELGLGATPLGHRSRDFIRNFDAGAYPELVAS